ncbi:MAG: HNH endonuclease [bacterium]|nr:HNH endonuclease [bacterium]
MLQFELGQTYTRADIKVLAGLSADAKGGNWDTGVVRHDDEFIIFPNVGVEGTTGHDYNNRWKGRLLHWYHKNGSTLNWPSVRALLDADAIVHLFWRVDNRAPFTYAGPAKAVDVADRSPVEVLWSVPEPASTFDYFSGPDETSLDSDTKTTYREGGSRTVTVNRYERDPKARQKAIDHYGCRCSVCDLRFEDRYGNVGFGYIHVHHLDPLAGKNQAHVVDPIKDLRPVCPNCHAMLHQRKPPFTIEELKAMLI